MMHICASTTLRNHQGGVTHGHGVTAVPLQAASPADAHCPKRGHFGLAAPSRVPDPWQRKPGHCLVSRRNSCLCLFLPASRQLPSVRSPAGS